MLTLFSAGALTSAFLLFWVEPLFAKMVLPLLGGSPAVWNTCLMFFQSMLLLGYLYAHLSSRYLEPRRQAWLHVGLLVLALASLPIAIPRGSAPPASGNVIPWLVQLLSVAVGAPFLILAATAPLLQRWLSISNHPAAKNPYMLYAASNTGSLLGLLAFPVLLEPHLRLRQQAVLWSIGYGFALALIVLCATIVWRNDEYRTPIDGTAAPNNPAEPAPTLRDRLRWVALAFIPSSLLLGVTTYLSTDVAAMPLLWVVPLALYLITFIVVFARGNRLTNQPAAISHAVLVTMLVIALYFGPSMGLRWEYALNLGAFMLTALVLHGELAASRPSPAHLTEFYLWMALGGALGGAFNAVVAPLLFKSIAEYQIVLVLACFLRPSWRLDNAKFLERVPWVAALVPAALLGVITWNSGGDHHLLGISVKMLTRLVAGILVLAISANAFRFGIGVAAIALVGSFLTHRYDQDILRDRSFFGAYRVQAAAGPAHRLVHGTTTHGAQFLDSARRRTPITYYHPRGPVGVLFAALQSRLPQHRIGAIGLGAGTVLCYSRPGEQWTFFEIDPLVKRISSNPRYFTYLRDCAVRPTIVIGDARLTLSRQPEKSFGLLIVDAFSSDAIPVHLLTREAFALYEMALDEHGILFVHISNQHLDLQPVVAALAADAGLIALVDKDDPSATEEVKDLQYPSDWVAIARRKEDLGSLNGDSRWQPLLAQKGYVPWSDDYSNVFSVIRW